MDKETPVEKVGADPIEVVEKDANAAGGIDYAAELAVALDARDQAEKEKENYKRGIIKAKGKLPEEEEADKEDEIQRRVDAAIAKALPTLQASLVGDNVDTVLREISSDPNEAKLIKYHFENSVGMNGTIRERLENAKLIANKKMIFKKQSELGIALRNRQQFSGTGFGSNSQSVETVQDRVLSPQQLSALKARGWDDKKIQRFKENLAKNKVM